MASLGAILRHPDDFYALLRLKMSVRLAEKQIPPEEHWEFSYTMLHKVSRSFALVIQQLDTDLRNAVCIYYLVLRGLDTVEDDTSIPADVKVPILKDFHRHIFDRNWRFSCGTKEYKVLMDQFHHVSTALLELKKGYQEAIGDITKQMGEGMAKFVCKEMEIGDNTKQRGEGMAKFICKEARDTCLIWQLFMHLSLLTLLKSMGYDDLLYELQPLSNKIETIEDYDNYCHYVAGLVGCGLSKLFYASGLEDMASDSLSNSMGLFLQKTNIIRDYLEDINEIPHSRMFWPRQVWSKYVNKLEDLKFEENSVKAVQCLNEMVTNALLHVEDCLKYMSALRDNSIFRFCAIPQIMAIGTLSLCYNNIAVFGGVVKLRRGLTAKVIDRTRTMADVYGAFFDFAAMLKAKVDKSDPNAAITMSRLDAIQQTCKDSGLLKKRRSYILESEPRINPAVVFMLFIILSVVVAYLANKFPKT